MQDGLQYANLRVNRPEYFHCFWLRNKYVKASPSTTKDSLDMVT